MSVAAGISRSRPFLPPESDRLVRIAADFAFAAGANEIEREHLIAALIHQRDALAVVTASGWSEAVHTLARSLPPPRCRAAYIPVSRAVVELLRLSERPLVGRPTGTSAQPGEIAYRVLHRAEAESWPCLVGSGPLMHEDALKVVLRLAMRERTPSRAARTAAVHEAGHALAMHAAGVLPDEIRMGGGTGPDSAVTYAPFDWHAGVLTAGRGRRWLRVMMAGRAAESLEFGAVSSGCESDLDAARALAKGMLSAWALEPWPEAARASVGSRAASGGNAPAKRGRPRERDAVEMLLHRAEDEAGDLLKQRRQTLRLLARELLARPVIYRADLARMLGEPPVVDGADPYGLGGPE